MIWRDYPDPFTWPCRIYHRAIGVQVSPEEREDLSCTIRVYPVQLFLSLTSIEDGWRCGLTNATSTGFYQNDSSADEVVNVRLSRIWSKGMLESLISSTGDEPVLALDLLCQYRSGDIYEEFRLEQVPMTILLTDGVRDSLSEYLKGGVYFL